MINEHRNLVMRMEDGVLLVATHSRLKCGGVYLEAERAAATTTRTRSPLNNAFLDTISTMMSLQAQPDDVFRWLIRKFRDRKSVV